MHLELIKWGCDPYPATDPGIRLKLPIGSHIRMYKCTHMHIHRDVCLFTYVCAQNTYIYRIPFVPRMGHLYSVLTIHFGGFFFFSE